MLQAIFIVLAFAGIFLAAVFFGGGFLSEGGEEIVKDDQRDLHDASVGDEHQEFAL
jgi:hypothetical protein